MTSSPDREEQRLAALACYQVMDTVREPAFDEIAALTAAICDAPIAVVNFVDRDRQFFKAEVGLGVDTTPLESSFCAHALLEDDFLLVPDLAADARFACNPLVTGDPRIRFYAGALLKTPDGLPIGTLCVLDHRARTLTEVQQRTLRVLARQVMAQLEQRRATRDAEDARRDLQWAQEAGGVGVFHVGLDGLVHGTPGFCRLYGLADQGPIPAPVLEELVVPEDGHLVSTAATRADGSAVRDVEYRIRRADTGEVRWIARRGEMQRDDQGAPVRFAGVAQDITAYRAARDALARSEERYRALFDAIDDAFCIIEFFDGPHGPSSDYVHVEANAGYERHTGIAGVVGKTLRDLAPGEADAWLDLYGGVLRTGEPIRFERYFEQAGRYIEVSAARVEPPSRRQVSVMFRDVNDRKRAEAALQALNETLEQRVAERTGELMRAEEQLRQAQKMEAVGQLTGGIAHDFNNLLTGVIGSLDLLQRRLARGELDKVERYATAAITSANRAAALTHRLLAFSRRQPLDPKPVGANRLVTGMEELLRRTIGESVRLEIVTAGGLWQTLCDPHQLESAILNLAINARDAMPDGGTLTIETCNAHLDNAYAAQSREVEPGQYICICVTDTGTGMSADVMARVFEPFFTTKPIGQGTGLGLSMIYGFARQSNGYAKIYSEEGKGTTFKLYLPRHYGDGEEPGETSDAVSEEHRSHQGEVVLVVEDETAVRDLVVEVLGELGYRAVEAVDGPSGLKLLQSDMRVDLLVTDIGLPGLNGRQLADAAREKRPTLKVLFMTGYAENATLANGFLEPGMEMITKPFAIDALAARIAAMIESAR